jgi:hypothetical protein
MTVKEYIEGLKIGLEIIFKMILILLSISIFVAPLFIALMTKNFAYLFIYIAYILLWPALAKIIDFLLNVV